MGLDISAYSHLRYVKPPPDDGEDWDYDRYVYAYEVDGNRADGRAMGLYAHTHPHHVWWHAEHGNYDIPDEECERIDQHIAGLRDGSTKPGTPGDLAVMPDALPITEQMGFRAGSYSGYNWWRKQLSQCALEMEPDEVWEGGAADGAPFVELIDFPDNEGVIGPETSAKLLADFEEHEARVLEVAKSRIKEQSELEYFTEIYGEFKAAFGLAAANGFVMFH